MRSASIPECTDHHLASTSVGQCGRHNIRRRTLTFFIRCTVGTIGKRHLGAALGEKSTIDSYIKGKVQQWVNEVEELVTVARTHPQAAYAAFTHGMASKWSYLMRTVEATQQLLQPREDAIRQLLLPAITGKPYISDLERDLIALPAHLGGLGIPNPTATSPTEHKASLQVTAPSVDAIIERHGQFNTDTIAQQQQCKVKVRQEKREAHLARLTTPKLQKLMDVGEEKERRKANLAGWWHFLLSATGSHSTKVLFVTLSV